MTALAAARQQKKIGEHPLPEALEVPMAASKIWQGGIVVANSSGYAASASTGVGLYALGVADETKDNSAGAAGDLKIKVTPGTFLFVNSGTTDALTQADVGHDCFIVDDQTVARTSSNGTRSRAGRVHSVTSAGVYVTVGVPAMTDAGTLDVHVVAAADLSAKQYYIMKVTGSGADVADSAGMSCLGVLQNAPSAAAIAVVRVLGVTRCIAGGALGTVGTDIATTNAGKAKAAVSGTTQGGVGDPVVGSFALGKQLTTAAGDTSAFSMVLLHQGALPGTAA